jgi:O-antigen/teichoic acid export membrane protein
MTPGALPGRVPGENANRHLLRGGLFNSSSWAINTGIQLLMIPFLVRRFGMEGFGIYSLLVSIIGYSVLADLGLGQGVIKFVAEMKARGDFKALNQYVIAGLWVQTLLGGIGMSLLVIFSRQFLLLLKVPSDFMGAARIGLIWCAIAFFFTMITGTFMSVLMGLQRYDLTSRTTIMINMAMNAGIVLVLLFGGGFRSAVAVTAAFALVNGIIFFVLVKKNLPGLVLFGSFDFIHFRDLFRFSGFLFISRVASLFCNYILVFMISFFLGPVAVPLYSVPFKLVNGATGFLSMAAAVVFPFASEMSVEKNREKINAILIQSSRLLAAISIPMNLTIAVFARPILTVWMGTAFAVKAAPILSLLALMSMLSALTILPNLFTMGLGFAKIIGIFSLGTLASFMILVPLGLISMGIVGAGWAIVFSTMPGLALVAYEVKKIFFLPLGHYAREVLGFHVLPILLMFVYFVFFASWLPCGGIGLLVLPSLILLLYFSIEIISGRLPMKKIFISLIAGR